MSKRTRVIHFATANRFIAELQYLLDILKKNVALANEHLDANDEAIETLERCLDIYNKFKENAAQCEEYLNGCLAKTIEKRESTS